jgi:hypothetical protein
MRSPSTPAAFRRPEPDLLICKPSRPTFVLTDGMQLSFR